MRAQLQRFTEMVRSPDSTAEECKAAAEALSQTANGVSRSEAEQALVELAGLVTLPDPNRAALAALAGGALIEASGCAATPLANPLLARLQTLLEAAVRLKRTCLALTPPPSEVFDDEPDPEAEFGAIYRRVAPDWPEEQAAWEALLTFWRPAVVVLCASPSLRATAQRLREPAREIELYHPGAYWLAKILSVLDREPLLVIEPATSLGIVARISGVVDNFQLHMLLMDQFPQSGWFASPRLPSEVAALARGEGPQSLPIEVTGSWNLHSWEALGPDAKLPEPTGIQAHPHWIWGEGIPAEIPVFEGHRAVLLGPPSYRRSWTALRMFARLEARLEIERKLSRAEVAAWLQRMSAARARSR